MFELLIYLVVAIVAVGIIYAYSKSRDVFHPLMFIGPMMIVMYAWMPYKLYSIGGLNGYFQEDQLQFVQWINVAGVAAFVLGCMTKGLSLPKYRPAEPEISPVTLLICGAVVGGLGLAAWVTTIMGVGGFSVFLTDSTSGGWDDSGYIRDGTLLMFPGFLLVLSATFRQGFRFLNAGLMLSFLGPWILQSILTSRRGPTFMIAVVVAMGWFLHRRTRPSLITTAGAGILLGLAMLFLVSNRGAIYIGSDQELNTDVTSIIETPDTGNEYIYGSGSILAAEQQGNFYWGRRYLAEVLVRPIPRAVWPDKYADFGLPELEHNAGTGEGFEEALGWEGAAGSAPGVIADLWLEFRWLNIPVLFLLGGIFVAVWRKASVAGGPWIAQYAILAALSIYFVMQTMEAVIFRLLILSFPIWLSWRIARRAPEVPVVLPYYDDNTPFDGPTMPLSGELTRV